MDELRARAYLDILLDKDSRPGQDAAGGDAGHGGDTAHGRRMPATAADAGTAGPPAEAAPEMADRNRRGPEGRREGRREPVRVPAGFAGRVNLTVPLTTLLDLADRPGEIPGIGPIDPALAATWPAPPPSNPKTTWCVTVTDEQGHAIGHGCARPEPRNHDRPGTKRGKPGPPGGPDPPCGTSGTPGPGFSFTACGQHGPPGGYGSWRLRTGAGGPRDLLVVLDPITTSATATTDTRRRATIPALSSGT